MTTVESGDRTSSLIPTLSAEYYLSADVFQREINEIFGKTWICAERTSEIPQPGAFRKMQIADESVIITRNREGELRAFLNSCRHRGTTMCEEERGEIGRFLRCPYHAWTYDLDGRLVAAPNMSDMADMDRANFGLVSVALREYLGFVWLNLDDDPVSFEDTVVAEANSRFENEESLAQYDLDDLAIGERRIYEVQANWKVIMENFYECYHCSTVHPQLIDILPTFGTGVASQLHPGEGAPFSDTAMGFTIDGTAGLSSLPHLSDEHERKYYGASIKPMVIYNLVPDHAIIHRLYPLSADKTVVECDWLFAPEAIAAGEDISKSVELFAVNNLQDFAVCERAQRGMRSRAYRDGGVFVPLEHHIADFHQWVVDRIG